MTRAAESLLCNVHNGTQCTNHQVSVFTTEPLYHKYTKLRFYLKIHGHMGSVFNSMSIIPLVRKIQLYL